MIKTDTINRYNQVHINDKTSRQTDKCRVKLPSVSKVIIIISVTH